MEDYRTTSYTRNYISYYGIRRYIRSETATCYDSTACPGANQSTRKNPPPPLPLTSKRTKISKTKRNQKKKNGSQRFLLHLYPCTRRSVGGTTKRRPQQQQTKTEDKTGAHTVRQPRGKARQYITVVLSYTRLLSLPSFVLEVGGGGGGGVSVSSRDASLSHCKRYATTIPM